MRKTQGRVTDDTISLVILAVGVVAVGIIIAFFVRMQRGLLGIILGALAVGLLVYWLREMRKVVREERARVVHRQSRWAYDLIDDKEEMTVIADVPGPADKVRIKADYKILRIWGGDNFEKSLTLPDPVAIVNFTYVNGVLNIRLKKDGA